MADGKIPVVCKCGAKMSAPATAAGKKAKCPKCQAVIQIPGGPASKPTAAHPATKPRPAPPPEESPEEETAQAPPEPPVDEEIPPSEEPPTVVKQKFGKGRSRLGSSRSRAPKPTVEASSGERSKAPTIGAIFGILFGLGMAGCGGLAALGGSALPGLMGETKAGFEKTAEDLGITTMTVATCATCNMTIEEQTLSATIVEGSACTKEGCEGKFAVTTRPMTEDEMEAANPGHKAAKEESAKLEAEATAGAGKIAIAGFMLLGAGVLGIVAGVLVLKRKKIGRMLTFVVILLGLAGAGFSATVAVGFAVVLAPAPALYAIVALATLMGSQRAAEFT